MLATGNLIPTPELRQKRHDEKRRAVLRFLRQQIWSTPDILKDVMLVSSRQACHKTLIKMELEGLIRKHELEVLVGRFVVWGITAHGQGMAFDLGNESPVRSYFEPSKLSEQTMMHQLSLQRLRLRAEKAGWANWLDGARMGSNEKSIKRPDAVADDTQGKRTAIECERTLKTGKRYEAILVAYLKALHNGEYSRVVWVCPTADFAIRLRTIITGIKQVRVNGRVVQIDPGRHHAALVFTDFIQWPAI